MTSRPKSDVSRSINAGWLESFQSIRPLLFKIIGRIARPDDIEDIVQETFVHSFAAARKSKIRNPRAFMLKTAKNIALNAVNKAEMRLNTSLDAMENIEEVLLPNMSVAIEVEYQSKEKFLVFCRSVAKLPLICRRVFILKKVYGYNQKEISQYLKISESTVEKHVAKGMMKTTLYLVKHGYGMDPKPVKNKTTGISNQHRKN